MSYGSSSLDGTNSGLLGITAAGSPFIYNAYDNTIFTPIARAITLSAGNYVMNFSGTFISNGAGSPIYITIKAGAVIIANQLIINSVAPANNVGIPFSFDNVNLTLGASTNITIQSDIGTGSPSGSTFFIVQPYITITQVVYDYTITSQLSSMTDVQITAPTNGQTLQYNSGLGKWVNA